MKDKNLSTVYALKVINRGAKIYSDRKKEYYNEGEYSEVAKCKNMQQYLYLLKALVLLDLEEMGIVKRGNDCIQNNTVLLNTFICESVGYRCHGVSFRQEIDETEEYDIYENLQGKKYDIADNIIDACARFLAHWLSDKYKEILHFLDPRKYYIFGESSYSKFIDLIDKFELYYSEIEYKYYRDYLDSSKYTEYYTATAYLAGTKLCQQKIGIFAFDESIKFDFNEEGDLQVEWKSDDEDVNCDEFIF